MLEVLTETSTMHIINPATEEIIETVTEDTAETVQEKYRSLKAGQPAWAATPLEKRIACIEKFYILLEEEKQQLAKILTSEMGKPLQQSLNELNGARSRIKYFIEKAPGYLADEQVTIEGNTKEKIVYEPLGVLANISAWNYPWLVGVNVFIPALIAGNAVLYKPSEYTTLTGLQVERLLQQAGIPGNCFAAVTGKGAVGELLLNLPLDGYFFTGSYRTGKYIAEKVAPKLVPCQLELGGKDPLYVMDDIDNINNTAAAVLEGVVYNNGQSCCAVERVYVHENIFDDFVTSIVAQAKKLKAGDPLDALTDIGPLARKEQLQFLLGQIEDAKNKGANLLTGGNIIPGKGYYIEPAILVDVNHIMKIMTEESFGPVTGIQKVKAGDPLDASTDIGPLARKEQLQFLLGQIEDAKNKGANLLTGGNAVPGKGYYIEPAILVNVNHSMKIMTEESFGPVTGIQKVKDDEEAVKLMLDTEYGLTAAVYSKSYERAEAVMKKMNTGTVYWNCCDRVSATLPWSGRKNSGLGTTLSHQGIRAFVQPKAWHMRQL